MKATPFFPIVATIILICVAGTVQAQDYAWAISLNKTPHTYPAAIRKDSSNNIYLATVTDSLNVPVATAVEKRNAALQLQWRIDIAGAAITDAEINPDNQLVVIGYFKDQVTIAGSLLTGTGGNNTGFIFALDEAGSLLWINALSPLQNRFEPVDLFITANRVMYLSAKNDGTDGMCSFHQLNASGNISKSEYTQTFENRTFSHIIADTVGNVYLSGTCGNFARFDDIAANPDYSYQHVLVMYDSSFTARWLLSRNYITFDDNNKLCTDGRNIYWVYDEFINNQDTVKIQKLDFQGQVLSTIYTPFPQVFFPSFDFSTGSDGNSTYLLQAGVQKFIYRYDSTFTITWQDTLMSQSSGFPLRNSLICYDSSFYMLGFYQNASLNLNDFTLANPNAGGNYRSDVFAFKWGKRSQDYTFNGNGNWSDQQNWLNSNMPPSWLPAGSVIYISPVAGGSCLLDVSQTIAPGAALIITSGAHFDDSGLLRIGR